MIETGKIPPPKRGGDEDLDDDLDAQLEQYIREVWNYYDPKNVGSINKGKAIQFFKDAMALFAARKAMKTKDLLKPGVSMNAALEDSFRQMDTSATGSISFKQFEEFVGSYTLDEALALITGNNLPTDISTSIQLADYSHLASSSDEPKKAQIEYRDYGALEN